MSVNFKLMKSKKKTNKAMKWLWQKKEKRKRGKIFVSNQSTRMFNEEKKMKKKNKGEENK